jgi:septal ring factor EnvC (AmiA/AmiB activator)
MKTHWKKVGIKWKSIERKLKSIESKLKSTESKLKSTENQLKSIENKLKSIEIYNFFWSHIIQYLTLKKIQIKEDPRICLGGGPILIRIQH